MLSRVLHSIALLLLACASFFFAYELIIVSEQDHQRMRERLWQLGKLHTQQYQNVLEIRSSLVSHFSKVEKTNKELKSIVSEIMNPVRVGNRLRLSEYLPFSLYDGSVAKELNEEFHKELVQYEKLLDEEEILIDKFRIMYSILIKASREVTVQGIELEHSLGDKVALERIHSIVALLNDKILNYYTTGDPSVIRKARSYIREFEVYKPQLTEQTLITVNGFIRNLTIMLNHVEISRHQLRQILDERVLNQIGRLREVNKLCSEIVAFELKVLYVGLFLSILFLIMYGGVLITLIVNNARRKAHTADQIRSEFLTSVSHEIRTPMNGIIGMTELLLEEDLTERQRTRARVISNAADNLMNIINDILNFSEIEAGDIDLDPITFNFREYVEDISELYGRRASQKNIELIMRYHPKLQEFLIGDPIRIGQIISNLVSNAVKFTKEGYILINVEPDEEEVNSENSIRVKVSIEDTGIGISKDKQQYIFEHFTQGDGSYTREFEGTGIGLAICQKLVKALNGDIGMESATGMGSHFWFVIEMGLSSQEKAERPKVPEDIQETRIMIIDDLSVNRKVLQEQLNADNMDVACYGKFSTSLEVLRDSARDGNAFDIVLVDYSMPNRNGLEFAREVQQDELLDETAIVLLAEEDQTLIKQDYEKAGVIAVLRKPVRHSDLLDSISLIQKSKTENKNIDVIMPDILESRRSHDLPISVSEHITFDDLEVLLVEDNQVNQMLAEEMLLDLGCSVSIAENGAIAVEKTEEQAFDLIFMDCQMPVMDGFKATGEILKLQRQGIASEAPIIALTANALKGDREKCLDAGMHDYVAKPISKNILRDILIKWTPEGKKARSEYVELAEMWEDDTHEEKQVSNNDQSNMDATVSDQVDSESVDLNELYQVKKMLKERFTPVIEGFLEDSGGYLAQIEEGVLEHDLEKIASNAHTLKSSSASLGVIGVAELSQSIEKYARETEDYEAIQRLVAQLKSALGVVEPKLRELLNNVA